MPVDETGSNPFSPNTNPAPRPGVFSRVHHALLAPPRFDAFPIADTTTAATPTDIDHGPQEDVSARTPQPAPQFPPRPTQLNREAVEPQLARLFLDALAGMRDIAELLGQPIGPGAHQNVKAVSARDPVRVNASTSAQLVLPKNSGRRGLLIYSEAGTATMYLGFGNGTSLTTLNYVLQIAAGSFFSLGGPPFYGGEVSALFASAAGAVVFTELT